MSLHPRSILFVLVALGALACTSEKPAGLPPASEWKPPPPKPSRVGGEGGPAATAPGGASDPHAGLDLDEADPHAGLDMDDPAAGMGGDDPHAGIDMEDPHGGSAMEDPHGGQTEPSARTTVARGQVRAAGAAAGAVKPGAIMYIVAVPIDPKTGETRGSAVAVDKFEVKTLPMRFELSGAAFEGDVLVRAWTDADGEARTREPGDVEGQVRARLPSDKVDLVLDTVLR